MRRESRSSESALYIGSCRLTFRLPGNDSLKGKRRASRLLIERLRHRFNVAAAEVDAVGEHRLRGQAIGYAKVSLQATAPLVGANAQVDEPVRQPDDDASADDVA